MQTNKIFLIFFSVLYFVLSFVLLKNISPVHSHRESDTIRYESKAIPFYKTNRFFPKFKAGQKPLAPQPIGYSFLMGLLYKIFGINNNPLIFLQIILNFISAFFVFFAAKHLFNSAIATIAFALFSTNIGYLTFSQVLLSECLLVFFLTLFFERFAYFIKTKKTAPLLTATFVMGASTLIKPAALYFAVPTAIFAFCFLYKTFPQKISKKLLIILFSLICFFVPIKSLQLYNQITYGITEFTNVGTFNLYIWFWSKVITNQKKPDSAQKRTKIFNAERKIKGSMLTKYKDGSTNWNKLSGAFWSTVKANPFPFIKTWLQEMLKIYVGLFTSNLKVLVEPNTHGGDISFFDTNGSIFSRMHKYISQGTQSNVIKSIGYIEVIWSLLRFIFCLIGLIYLLLKRKWALFLFLSFYIFYFSFVPGFDGCARYRTMFEFVLIILASLGIYITFNSIKNKKIGLLHETQ